MQKMRFGKNRTSYPFIVLFAGMVVAYAAFSGQAHARQSERPNVVFILSDDHRYDFMSFMEEAPGFLRTPHMDRMAAEGAHLPNAFVTTSLCSPSRATILTGKRAHEHGVVDNQHFVPPGTVFFSQYLQKAGYRTEWNYPQTPTTFALRTDRYKYIFYYGIWDANELYDIKLDPLEKVNLIDVPEHRKRAEMMRDALFSKLHESGGMTMPLRAPHGNPNDQRKKHDSP